MPLCQMNHPFVVDDPELSERLYKMLHNEATVEQQSNLGHFSEEGQAQSLNRNPSIQD